MAITLIAVSDKNNSATSTTTPAQNYSGASLFVAFVSYENNFTSIADNNGNTWIAIGGGTPTTYSSSGKSIRCYYSNPTSAGSGQTVTFTASASGKIALAVLAFAGTATSTPYDANGPVGNATTFVNAGVTMSPTAAFTPANDNDVVISATYWDRNGNNPAINNGTFTIATTLDPDASGAAALGCRTAYVVQTTAASVQPGWTPPTYQNVYMGTFCVAFKAGPAPATPTITPERFSQAPRPWPFKPSGDPFRRKS